jgi:hypothetical protein
VASVMIDVLGNYQIPRPISAMLSAIHPKSPIAMMVSRLRDMLFFSFAL